MYNCFDVAGKFLEFAREDSVKVTPMKLLKLTYISHGYHLAFCEEPLFKNPIQAWMYGPVIPELYHLIKRFGNRSVDLETLALYTENKIDSDNSKFLKLVWETYKDYSGEQLSAKTHKDGTPWMNTYVAGSNVDITNPVIEKYYKTLIQK
jgi:uncharacterized phage-associated protein